MKNKTLLIYKGATALIPIIILFLFITREYFITIVSQLPTCIFYTTFHQYCPSCGNTRSVTALLHGDIFQSIRYNISPILFGFLLFLAYIEMATYSFGKHIHLLPRKLSFYITLLIILVLYMIIRNFSPYLTP